MNIFLSKNRSAMKHASAQMKHVSNNSGDIQSESFLFNFYQTLELLGKLDSLVFAYSRNGGHYLGGGNVISLFDLALTNKVPATQPTVAQRPLWGTDANISGSVPVYSNDFLDINKLGALRKKSFGTVIAICKDTLRTGGDGTHIVVTIQTLTASGSPPAASSRAALITRDTSNPYFTAVGRRNNSDAARTALVASSDGWHMLECAIDWTSTVNNLSLYVDGALAQQNSLFTTTPLFSDDTDSYRVAIGDNGSLNTKFSGPIGEVLVFDSLLSATDRAIIKTLFKKYYTTIP